MARYRRLWDTYRFPGVHPLLDRKRQAILDTIREKGAVTVRDLLPKLDISERAVRLHLQLMAERGLIRTEGSRKTMRYTAV